MIRFEEFERLGLVAAFSEADDGDFSLRSEAGPSALEARGRFAAACGLNACDITCVQQVHGTDIICVRAQDRGRGATDWHDALGPADALLTDVPGLPLAVLVADCVPVYLFDPVRRAGGLIHAGWRGTFEAIAARAVQSLQREWNTDPADIYAVLGPSAGPCCYEVSPELADELRRTGLAAQGRMADLWESNARVLVGAGVPREHIHTAALCTICDHRFHSHRRNATPARNMALLAAGRP